MPPPLQVELLPFDLENGVRVTCDVGYLCANFSLARLLCSRLRPDVRDRQTSDARRRLMHGRRHGFESGGGDNFARSARKKKFLTPTFWPVGGQNIA